jgi:N-acetylmuramoyl-L-alanine amidase
LKSINFNNNTLKLLLFLSFWTSSLSFGQNSNFKVTLDAGHGAHDFGAVYNGHVEKNIALAVVLKVGKLLEANSKVDVTYTRKTDVFIDLVERANIANGTETYVMGMNKVASNLEAAKKENSVITLEKDYKRKYEGFDPNSPETMIGLTLMQEEYLDNSISLASKIENSFDGLGKRIRGGGVKQAPFMVLHKAYMPRVLVEMGFISNYIEGNLLDSEEGQNEIAKAIADAIVSYKNEYYGNGGVEINETRPSQKNIENNSKDSSTPVEPKKTIVKQVNSNILFKVQISASSRKMELKPTNFKGLSNISIDFDNSIYRYMYGETSDYNEAMKLLDQAKEKGYGSAFLIAFKNGKKINLQEAIKL